MKTSALALRLPDFFPARNKRRLRIEPCLHTPKRAMATCTLRPATTADLSFLWSCLATAAHEPMGSRVLTLPSLSPYLRGWMRANDFGFIASRDGKDIGAVWARQFQRADQPYVWVAGDVPELTISVQPDYQGQGVGQSLLNELAVEARQRNLKGLCLNVREENPAIRLFSRIGFQPLENSEITNRTGGLSFGMLLSL